MIPDLLVSAEPDPVPRPIRQGPEHSRLIGPHLGCRWARIVAASPHVDHRRQGQEHGPTGPGERLLEELIRAAQLASPAELPVVLSRYAGALGLGKAAIYLVDIQQRLLVPLVEGEPELDLDTSLAGWAYRTESLRVEEGPSGKMNVWLPLADGAERLGVVELNMSTLDGLKLRRCRTTALLLALIITFKRTYSDTIAQRMRTRPMHLPTEMVRAFLPPRSIGTGRVVSTAVLEPAYELGGDAFDHAFTEDVLHATILDGMGHNLASGLATSVAMACCRNARRSGADLNPLWVCPQVSPGPPVRCTTSASNPVTACIGTTNSATTPRSATPTQAGASGDGLQVIGRSRALLTGDAAGGLVPAVARPAVNDQHARQPPAT